MSGHADHDQHPLDEDETLAQVAGVAARLAAGPGRVLDLGCGTGRVAGMLAAAGHDVTGIDREPDHRARFLEVVGDRGRFERLDFTEAAGLQGLPPGPFDAILLLGNTLTTVRSPVVLRDLFRAVAARLDPEGIFVYDDFPFTGWSELTAGNWGDGISEDGSMQMLWVPGEPEFVMRTGSEVDDRDLEPRPEERVLRLWSMSELNDAAFEAGLAEGGHDPAASLVLHVHRDENPGIGLEPRFDRSIRGVPDARSDHADRGC